jgi:hypothetical protein
MRRTYPNLLDFFCRKLGITSAPPDVLVEELRVFAERHQHGPVPQEVQGKIANLLADISKILKEKEDKPIPLCFQDLANIAIFPASVPSEGVALRTADEFYVPDKSGKYANVFRERVALLAFTESAILPIRPLLESSIFKDRIRDLDNHVTKRPMPTGERVPEPRATELFSSRVEYIARYTLLVEPEG